MRQGPIQQALAARCLNPGVARNLNTLHKTRIANGAAGCHTGGWEKRKLAAWFWTANLASPFWHAHLGNLSACDLVERVPLVEPHFRLPAFENLILTFNLFIPKILASA